MTLSWPSDQFVPFARGDTRKPRRWGGQIVFGIETPDLYVLSVYESAFHDGVQHARNALVQNRLRSMLKNRHAPQMASAAPAMAPVGKQQYARSERYERYAQKQAPT